LKFQVNNDRSRDYTIPNPAIQPPLLGQQPPMPMPGGSAPAPYNGVHYGMPPSSTGWGPTTAPPQPQPMTMQMQMQNYPYVPQGAMPPGAVPPGPPGTMPQGSMQPEMGPGMIRMQNPGSVPPGGAMPPYSQ